MIFLFILGIILGFFYNNYELSYNIKMKKLFAKIRE